MTGEVFIRAARLGDEQQIFALIQALAEYEQLAHAVTGNAEQLAKHLFGPHPAAAALVAESGERLLGFALFFGSYSTFLTQPGLYLEDIFVLPNQRRRGIGKALLARVAEIANERKCARVEWSVLDWNADAIAFYERVGAKILADWRICRVTGAALCALVREARGARC